MYDVSSRFLDVITGSHRAVVRAQVLPTATMPQFGASPTGGTGLTLLDGDVKLTSTADVNGSVDLTISSEYWDLLRPYGAELFVERGIDFGDGTQELVPCGYYGIEEMTRDSAGPVRVSAFDRSKRMKRNRVIYPIEFPAGATHRRIFEHLVNGVTPAGEEPRNYGMFLGKTVPITWTAYDPDIAKIGTSLTCEDDAQEFLAKLADARGCVLRFSRTGELLVQARNLAPGAEPVYAIAPGVGGNLVDWSQKITRDGVYNYVVARGSDPANPTGYRLAVNSDRNSPLLWEGPFGTVVRYYASPLILTSAAADLAAETVLARYKGLPLALSMMTVPNPALDPLDVVQATLAGSVETHLIDQVAIPLVTGSDAQPVEIVTRTLNEIPTDEDPGGGGFPNPDPGGGPLTAAEKFNWGTPLAASDDFTDGLINPAKWAVYNGPGHNGNGRRLPARVAVINGILTLTGLANGDTAGLAHVFDQQYGRWEIRVRSFRTTTDPGPDPDPDPGGGGTPTTRTAGPGGIPRPQPGPNVVLASADTTSSLTISSGGSPGSPKIYDGGGHKIGRITVKADYVTVQNYRIVADSQYAAVLDADNVTFQNNDLSGIHGPGDINGITAWGNRLKILYNTMINAVSNPGGSHTDFVQTWVSSSHPTASSDWEIVGNIAIGPANPSRNNSTPSIHQWLMTEDQGLGGNSGGSSSGQRHLYIADNTMGDSWNQSIKLDGFADVVITRNKFVGSSNKVMDIPHTSNVTFYSDNQVGSGYGSVGMSITSGAGPATNPWPF